MADSEKFYMQSPLVQWIETFKAKDGHPLEYHDLFDGVFLNDVMQQIDTRAAYDNVNRFVKDVSVRLHNWDLLVKNIREFYCDVLQQLLVIRLPNISVICREQDKSPDASFVEVRKALLLILGCAVQCEQKEAFIDKIMSMDVTTQTELVENIKEVTDDCEAIISIQRPESPLSLGSYIDKMFHHLHRVIKERDECSELATELGQDHESYMSQTECRGIVETQQKSPDRHSLALELAESKAGMRQLRQQLEDKQESLSDLKFELHECLASCSQLKNENAMLIQEARTTRLLRDELDIMKEKASKVAMFEKEIMKYKERLNEFEFYKARTLELKEDNAILEETKAMLEDQLSNCRKKIDGISEMESNIGIYKQQIEEMSKERDLYKEKVDFLNQENAWMKLQRKTNMANESHLESEQITNEPDVQSSLSEQLSETSLARMLRLELENQRLESALNEMKKNTSTQNAEMTLEFEKENQRLLNKVKKLQSGSCELSQQVTQLEADLSAAREEKDNLKKMLDSSNEKSEQHIQELETKIEQLTQALSQLRERSEKSNDLRVKDLERENKRLHETVTSKSSLINGLEFENRQHQQSILHMQEQTQRLEEVEHENLSLEKENTALHQKVSTLEHTMHKLEGIMQENSDMCVEKRKLLKSVETLTAAVEEKEKLEKDHISLLVEHQHLQRMLETLKAGSDKAVELESERDYLNKELEQLKKLLDGQKVQRMKQEQIEFEIIDMGNENQRLQKNLETTQKLFHQLEKDNMNLEIDNEKMSKEVETLRITVKQLQSRDVEACHLEEQVQVLEKDKAVLEKENRKLKQASELKDSSLDDVNAKLNSLNLECKCLKQSVDKMKETCDKVKDLEKENKEILQELNTDRRTLATLREELVNEKIHCQDLSNQLEQLTSELEKVGIDTEKLYVFEQTNDANRYKALETMIDETFKKGQKLKEEKIRALETKLDESKSWIFKLEEDLTGSKMEVEMLKQKLIETETSLNNVALDRKLGESESCEKLISSDNKDILQLKDQLVQLKHQNATLLTDADNLRSNNQILNEQCRKLENQLSNIDSQHATLQGQFSNLHEEKAKLQLKYNSLQSQHNSGMMKHDLLKKQMSQIEVDSEDLGQKYDMLHSSYLSFMSKHESLQSLYEHLTLEYESLLSDHDHLKQQLKSSEVEMKDAKEQVKQGKDDVNKLRNEVESERNQIRREIMSFDSLQSDYQLLREDHNQLRSAYDKLSNDYHNMLVYHKQVKTDYNMLQLKIIELQADLMEARENVTVSEVVLEKLENKMEAIYQLNEKLENENQSLLVQIQKLLNQNQELLTQTLNSKNHFAEEERSYVEKLSELRREKERLEEKMKDHYKNRLSPKRKGLGALIAKKARDIITRGTKFSKSKNNLSDLLETSSQGSSSVEQFPDSCHTSGNKSSNDINASTLPEHMSQSALVAQGANINMEGKTLLACEQKAVEDTSKIYWDTVDSNLSDDSCADELKALELAHLDTRNQSDLRDSLQHSNNNSTTFQQQWQPHQHFQDSLSQSGSDIYDESCLPSVANSELNNSVANNHLHNDIKNIHSNGTLSHQVYKSPSKWNSFSAPSTNISHNSCTSSFKNYENNQTRYRTDADDCSSQFNQRKQELNLFKNDPSPALAFQPSNKISANQSKVGYSVNNSLYGPPQCSPDIPRSQNINKHQLPAHPQPPKPGTDSVASPGTSELNIDELDIIYSQPYDQLLNNTNQSDVSWHRDGTHSSHIVINHREIGLERKPPQFISPVTRLQHPSQQTHSVKPTNNQLREQAHAVTKSYMSSPESQTNLHCFIKSSNNLVQPCYNRETYSMATYETGQNPQSSSSNTRYRRVSGEHQQAASETNSCNFNSNQSIISERSKSVPPHLFERPEHQQSNLRRGVSASPAHKAQVAVEYVRNIDQRTEDGRDAYMVHSTNFSTVRYSPQYNSKSTSHSLESHTSQHKSQVLNQQEATIYNQRYYNDSRNMRHNESKSVPVSQQHGSAPPSFHQDQPTVPLPLQPTPSLLTSQQPILTHHKQPQASQANSYSYNDHTIARSEYKDHMPMYTQHPPRLYHQPQVHIESRQQEYINSQDPDKMPPNKSSHVRRSHSSVGSAPHIPSSSLSRSNTLARSNPASNLQRNFQARDMELEHHRVKSRQSNVPVSLVSEDQYFYSNHQNSDTNYLHSLHSSSIQTNHSSYQPHRGDIKSDPNSYTTKNQQDGSPLHQALAQPHIRSHGKTYSNEQTRIPLIKSTREEINLLANTVELSPSHSKTSQVSPQSKSVQNVIKPSSEMNVHQQQKGNSPSGTSPSHSKTLQVSPQSKSVQTVIKPSSEMNIDQQQKTNSVSEISPSHSKNSPISPESKSVQPLTKSKDESQEDQPPKANSIWYEYGCV